MPKHLIQISCPCCKEPLEIDTRNGKARRLRPAADGLDALIEGHRGESDRLGKAFDSAQSETSRESERFDRLFRDAKKKADEDPDEGRPRSPFDLD